MSGFEISNVFTRPATGASFTDQLHQAKEFFATARGGGGQPAAVADVAEAFVASGSDVAPTGGGAASVATGMADDAAQVGAAVVGNDPDALAAAARQASQAAMADPAIDALTRQAVQIEVQPHLIMQGQGAATVVPVEIAVPASQPAVSFRQPIVTVVDPATGQAIAQSGGQAAGAGAAAAGSGAAASGRAESFRKLGLDDIGNMFRRGGGEVAAQVAPEQAVARRGAGLVEQLQAAAQRLQGAPHVADEVAEAVVNAVPEQQVASRGQSVLAGLQEAGAKLSALRTAAPASAAASGVVDDTVKAVATSGIGDELARLAKLL